MRTMVRNKTTIFYANYQGKTRLRDEYGNLTGEYKVSYGTPVEVKANVSAASGEATTSQFGNSVSYDKVIVLDNPKFPISETSVLWIDTLPVIAADGTTKTPHDYIVKRVATSLNSISIAVSKVNING